VHLHNLWNCSLTYRKSELARSTKKKNGGGMGSRKAKLAWSAKQNILLTFPLFENTFPLFFWDLTWLDRGTHTHTHTQTLVFARVFARVFNLCLHVCGSDGLHTFCLFVFVYLLFVCSLDRVSACLFVCLCVRVCVWLCVFVWWFVLNVSVSFPHKLDISWT
jgi:hypothetical protein